MGGVLLLESDLDSVGLLSLFADGTATAPPGICGTPSFVLHIADELIHHTAEAALLRDLFAGASVRS